MKSKILNVILGVALVVTGMWSYTQYQTRLSYETFIQNQNQRSYLDFTSNLENLESLTSKSLVSTSSQNRALMLSDIWWQSNVAQQNLAQLPFDGGAIRKTTKFLTQLGDYSYALAKKSSKDIPMSNGDINKLQDLHNQVGSFGEELRQISEKNGRNANGFAELKAMSYKADEASKNLMNGTFKRLDKQMQQYPTLVYDGPFADHIQQKNPLGLSGRIVTAVEAKKIAIDFVDKSLTKKYAAVNTGLAKGKIPAYNIRLDGKGKQQAINMDITRKGGKVVFMINPRRVNSRTVSTVQARTYADKFLTSNGYGAMVPSYSFRQGNSTVFTFVYRYNKVIVYPDLIKVKVALDNGEIVGFEALNYLMNHHFRSMPKPEFAIEKARARIPNNLKIASEKTALIPSETGKEILCYEFRVKMRGDTFLIYINAINGDEEQILKIIDAPNGEWAL